MPTVVLVLVQVLIIIGISRLMGLGCRVIKQPLVIGEIIAGIMLGPSLLGSVAPELATSHFILFSHIFRSYFCFLCFYRT